MNIRPILAIIPARGGSKDIPRKNIADLAGIPLIAHSIKLAKLCPEISVTVVSTDCAHIAEIAREYGGEVPFLRPSELAQDDTPTMPVLKHALMQTEALRKTRFESVLLLQPTNPSRLPEDVTNAVKLLESDPLAAGILSASEPAFNPRWVCIEEREGYVQPAFDASTYGRRQDVPRVFRINGLLYLWRREYILNPPDNPWNARRKMLIVPEERVMDIDTPSDMIRAELLLKSGLIKLPWIS